jgi:hypothetical protein
MIFGAADDDRLTIQIRENSAKVMVHFFAQLSFSQIGAAILSGEHCVQDDFG